MHGSIRTKSKYQGCSLDDGDDWYQFKNGNLSNSSPSCLPLNVFYQILFYALFLIAHYFAAIRATIQETPPPSMVM